jgi:hypothetical protein
MQRVIQNLVGEGWCLLYQCHDKMVPKLHSGLHPSEQELPEQRSNMFRFKNTPGPNGLASLSLTVTSRRTAIRKMLMSLNKSQLINSILEATVILQKDDEPEQISVSEWQTLEATVILKKDDEPEQVSAYGKLLNL